MPEDDEASRVDLGVGEPIADAFEDEEDYEDEEEVPKRNPLQVPPVPLPVVQRPPAPIFLPPQQGTVQLGTASNEINPTKKPAAVALG